MARSLPAFLALAATAVPLAAQFTVTSVTPRNCALAEPTATLLSATFTAPVNRATVNAASFRVFGRWSGVATGVFSFGNGDRTVTFHPARPFFPGELVTVIASSGVSGAAAGNLVTGYTWGFWTRSAAGSGAFSLAATIPVRRPNEQTIQTYGAYAGDLDRDGSPDLSLPNETSNDLRVLVNDGCGGFSLPAIHGFPQGSRPSTNEGQDFNGDGFIDLAVGNINGRSISVFIGNGSGGYLPAVTYPSGDGTRGLAVLDANADGHVDIVTANRASSNMALHLNAGNGTFLPATFFDGGGDGETAVMAADANQDGIADLFVGNYNTGSVTLLLGNGAGGFAVSASTSAMGSPWMIAVGDVDGDGNADAVTPNYSTNRAAVIRGNGAGGLLAAVTYPAGTRPLAIDVGDVEGDGDLDLVVSNFGSADFTVFLNNGGTFGSSFTLPANSAGSCALVVDYDRDGDMDIVGIDEIADVIYIFRQTGPASGGVQPPSCGAALRVDNLANRGGFGNASPHGVPLSGSFFLGASGGPNLPYVVVMGLAVEPGAPTVLGLLNLDARLLVFLPASSTNRFGEDLVPIPVPPGLPSALTVAFQGILVNPGHPFGWTLTNPERIVLRP